MVVMLELAGTRLTMVIAGGGTALVGLVGLALYARVPREREVTAPVTI